MVDAIKRASNMGHPDGGSSGLVGGIASFFPGWFGWLAGGGA